VNRFKYGGWLLCLVPLLLSLVIGLAMRQGWLPNRVLIASYSVDTAAIITRVGLAASVLFLIGWRMVDWHFRQVQAAQDLVRSQAAQHHKLFVQRLDHEIKNPLAIIQLSVVNILDDLNDEKRGSAARLQTQVDRLRQLVMDLRSLTELEDRIMERNRVDLQPLLENAIETVLVDRTQRIELTVQHVPWPVGPVIGDADLLTIAFTNLLSNAVKFTSAEGSIRLQVTDTGQCVIVEVADNGIGIPSADVPHVFDELYRASNAARISGSGMGLALVQRIITLHHGEVSLRSREGHGTVITVQLPLANRL
jgi:two-component system OmpR family sensor kinase